MAESTQRRKIAKAPAVTAKMRRHSRTTSEADEVLVDSFGLPGLRISPAAPEEFTLRLVAEQVPKLRACPRCGTGDEDFILNGTRPQIVRDVPQGLRSTYVEIQRQSYHCKNCRGSTQHPLLAVSEEYRMTNRLVEYIAKLALLRPQREIALLTGASTKTVRGIAIKYRVHLDETLRFATPRVLGLDGVFARVEDETGKNSRKRQCTILTDIEAGLVLDLRPGFTTAEVRAWLRELPDRHQIKIVLIDMSHVLLRAVREALPHAVVVIDLFHVQSKINEGLDNVRKRLRKDVIRKEGAPTMCKKELLRKRPEQYRPHESKELNAWFELKPELRLAYETAQACLKIWYSSSSRTARARYRRWLERFPLSLRKDFKELLDVFSNWGDYIFNYFDHRYTNAFTESSNRLVKDVQREARGCHFKTLRARVIYGTWLKKQLAAARREEMTWKKRRVQPQAARKHRRKRAVQPAAVQEQLQTTLVSSAQSIALQIALFT